MDIVKLEMPASCLSCAGALPAAAAALSRELPSDPVTQVGGGRMLASCTLEDLWAMVFTCWNNRHSCSYEHTSCPSMQPLLRCPSS